MGSLIDDARALFGRLNDMPLADRIAAINDIKIALSAHSPFSGEPVDCVIWVPAASVEGNDYNPNSVAAPEMTLLELSILEDGYTQPIVTHDAGVVREVVDGFHRNRIGKESIEVRKRIHGYLPVVTIKAECSDKPARMASTIRHNRARGKHSIDGMSDIVAYLAKKGWDKEKIGKELGMEHDEVLRLKQITGLAELFADHEFSEAWDVA